MTHVSLHLWRAANHPEPAYRAIDRVFDECFRTQLEVEGINWNQLGLANPLVGPENPLQQPAQYNMDTIFNIVNGQLTSSFAYFLAGLLQADGSVFHNHIILPQCIWQAPLLFAIHRLFDGGQNIKFRTGVNWRAGRRYPVIEVRIRMRSEAMARTYQRLGLASSNLHSFDMRPNLRMTFASTLVDKLSFL